VQFFTPQRGGGRGWRRKREREKTEYNRSGESMEKGRQSKYGTLFEFFSLER